MSRVITAETLSSLSAKAAAAPRGRQHLNLHQSWSDPCQRMLNAILPHSYIRPHRHSLDPKTELLVAAGGRLGVLLFDQSGNIVRTEIIGGPAATAAAIEAGPGDWHSVVALSEDAVLLEIKSGPFDPAGAAEFAPWAPDERMPEAADYLNHMRSAF